MILALLICAAIITVSSASAATIIEQSDDLTETNWQTWSLFTQTFIPSGDFNTLVFKVYDTSDNAYFVSIQEIDPITQETTTLGSVSYIVPEEPGTWSNIVAKFNDITPVPGKIYKAFISGRGGYSFKMKGSSSEGSYPDGALSTGTGYESTLGNVKDLYFKVIEIPNISEIKQYKSDGTTEIPASSDIGEEKKVIFKASITSSVEEDATVQLKVNGELAGSDVVATNEDVSFEYENIPSGSYSWYLNVTDEDGNESGSIYGSSFTASDIPFSSETAQLSVNEGDSTLNDSITIRETLYDRDDHQVKLQVELREISQPFTGVEDGMIETSAFIDSGEYTDIIFSDLYKRKYHWRSRVIDSEDNASLWHEFGTAGNVDFMVGGWTESAPVSQLEAGYKSPYTTSNLFQSLGNGLSGTATSIKLRSSTNWGNPRWLDILECDSNVIGFDTEFPPNCTSAISGPVLVYVGANDYISHSINVTFDPEKFYMFFFYQNWELYGSTDVNTYHNGSIGSIGSPNSYDAIGDLKRVYFELEGANMAVPQITPFWGKINNSTGLTLRDKPFISDSTAIKELPNDWIVKIVSTENDYDYDEQAGENDGGYTWYQVVDATDNVSGYMAAKSPIDEVYLAYSEQDQNSFQEVAEEEIGVSERPEKIIEAINHYYNNEDTLLSLYSSDDDAVLSKDKISSLKDGDYPEKIIWGIMAAESGSPSHQFNNELVSFDYGHGISQITPPYVFYNEQFENGWQQNYGDSRGFASKTKIYPCRSNQSNLYINCYTNGGEYDTNPKSYKNYADNPTNPVYKYYSNKLQSIYANLKDGMRTIANKYDLYSDITEEKTINGITYSGSDRRNILTTERYRGNDCGYVHTVATRLDNIDDYFPGQSATSLSDLISKMHSAGQTAICAQLESPGELSIQDSTGKTVGVINGEGINDFPLAIYDLTHKFVKILATEDENYTYTVSGTDSGTYGLKITIKEGDNRNLSFMASEIPITLGEKHIYSVDKEALNNNQNDAVTISIMKNRTNKIFKVGNIINGQYLDKK